MDVTATIDPVPATAVFVSGAAYTQAGSRYTVDDDAPADPVMLAGIAHRADGAMYSTAAGTLHTLREGLPVSAAGVVLIDALSDVSNTQSGYPTTADGFLATNA